MAEQNTAAFGIYSDRLFTANAIETLRAAGFRDTDIVALFPDEIRTWQGPAPSRTKHLLGTLAGVGVGILFVSLLTWVASAMSLISFGTMEALIVLTAGGALGGLSGALAGRRISEYENRYERRVRRGDILLAVQCDDAEWTEKAKEILKRSGADDVSASDKVTVDLVRSNRILVRAVSERTAASPLRLVRQKSTRPENETPEPSPATSGNLRRRARHGA